MNVRSIVFRYRILDFNRGWVPLRSSATGPHPSPPPLRQGREISSPFLLLFLLLLKFEAKVGVG